MSATRGRLLATGNVAEVFEYGNHVVKLYKSVTAKPTVFREAAIHAAVADLGLPVPAVWGVLQLECRWGIVFDRVNQASFAKWILENPNDRLGCLERMAQLHLQIHAHSAIQLGSLKLRLAANIADTIVFDLPRKHRLFVGLAEMPEGDKLCHGDFHPLNILGDASQPIVIDWPDARRGHPTADVCRSYLLLKLHADELATPYLEAYCRISGVHSESILRWLPYVAAAKVAEQVPSELDRLLDIVRLNDE